MITMAYRAFFENVQRSLALPLDGAKRQTKSICREGIKPKVRPRKECWVANMVTVLRLLERDEWAGVLLLAQ
jgi:hypothetical protein